MIGYNSDMLVWVRDLSRQGQKDGGQGGRKKITNAAHALGMAESASAGKPGMFLGTCLQQPSRTLQIFKTCKATLLGPHTRLMPVLSLLCTRLFTASTQAGQPWIPMYVL